MSSEFKVEQAKVVQTEKKIPVSTRIKVKTDLRAGDGDPGCGPVGTNGTWSN
jgi:hypothetical protein